MNLPRLSDKWSIPELVKNLVESFRQIENAEATNRKTNADVELAGTQRLIITGDDGLRYAVSIVAGVLTATPV